MALLTLADVRKLIETDLEDDALQILLDDAEAAIIERAGEAGTATEEFACDGLGNLVWFRHAATAVSTVVEEIRNELSGYTATTLAADDYRLCHSGRALERLSSGTHSRSAWGDQVTATFTPKDDLATRKRVQADLVKLAVRNAGVRSEGIGDYSATHGDYDAEREKILSALSVRRIA